MKTKELQEVPAIIFYFMITLDQTQKSQFEKQLVILEILFVILDLKTYRKIKP